GAGPPEARAVRKLPLPRLGLQEGQAGRQRRKQQEQGPLARRGRIDAAGRGRGQCSRDGVQGSSRWLAKVPVIALANPSPSRQTSRAATPCVRAQARPSSGPSTCKVV